ncbi:MAG: TldD/PmbA family protein [Candidatus Parvarchaeota archaeon]|nr:TldD/PmbA family protein [Candidatus Parvarchaeota archaeon]MCW1301842.1 TldD/PmbA family protein [Candidatus Parvarchaeota archaeon]
MTEFEEYRDLPERLLKRLSKTVDFLQVTLEEVISKGVWTTNGKLNISEESDDVHLGVRFSKNGKVGFVSSMIPNKFDIYAIINQTKDRINKIKKFEINDITPEGTPPKEKYEIKGDGAKVEDLELSKLGKDANEISKYLHDKKVKTNNIFLGINLSIKLFMDSRGSLIESRIPSVNSITTLVIDDLNPINRYFQIGYVGSYSKLRSKMLNKLNEEIPVLHKVSKNTNKVVPRKYKVIVGSEISGLMAHESVGHPLELDRVMGREQAQGGSSYFQKEDVLNKRRIGSEAVSIYDDPTIPNSYGFYRFDSEGTRAVKRKLIDRGVVNSFLMDRSYSRKIGMRSNAALRSSVASMEPIIRMANTYVEPGSLTFEELLEQMGEGIYLKSFNEWNINETRENQKYVGLEAYYVKNGKIEGLIKDPVMEITTKNLWSNVVAVDRNLEFNAATCGKGDPMQGIPVLTGGPNMLIDGVMIY